MSHPFGHGKFENVASIIEAVLILGAAAMIIANAYPKPVVVEIHSLVWELQSWVFQPWLTFCIPGTHACGRKTESPALAADAWHLRTDVYTSLGVFAGILAIKITGLTILDPLIAIVVTLLIVRAAVQLIVDSYAQHPRRSASGGRAADYQEILAKYSSHYLEYHDLKTRKAGSQRFIVLHLVVPGQVR